MNYPPMLETLRELSLEEGKAFLQEQIEELSDCEAVGILLADEALKQLYLPFLSLKLAELLIFFGDYTQHLASHALGLKAKGDAFVQIGHCQAAIEALDESGAEFFHLNDEGNWARSRISWIIASASLGNVEEALAEAARARDIFLRLNELYWVCIIEANTGVIYAQTGRYQETIKVYDHMLAIYPTLSEQSATSIKRSIAIAEVNQALNLVKLGRFEQAYQLLQQAQTSFIELNEISLLINAEIHLAEIEYIRGYYGSALRRYYQAQDSLQQNNIDNPRLLAELKLQTASVLVKLNRAGEACQLAREAVAIYQQSATTLQASNALREYATALVASHQLQGALAALDESWLLFHQKGFDYYASITKLQQTELLLEMGEATEAYSQASSLMDYFEAQGLVARAIRASLVMVGSLIEQAQQAGKRREGEQQAILLLASAKLCKQSVKQAQKHHLQEEAYKGQSLLGKIFVLQGDILQAIKHYGASIAQIERMLDDLAYDLSPDFLHATWTVYEEMIGLYLQQGQIEQAFSYLERARSMALRQYLNKSQIWAGKQDEQEDGSSALIWQDSNVARVRTQYELKSLQEHYRRYSVLLTQVDTSVSPAVEKEIIEAELKRCETKLGELFERLYLQQAARHPSNRKRSRKSSLQRLDSTQLRQHLAPDQLLLVYFQQKERLIIFALTRESLTTYEIPAGAQQLRRLLPSLHVHLQQGRLPDVDQRGVRQMLNKLYKLLIAPVAAQLPPSSGYLTIVPYGPLHTLPFHALYDGNHFLIENYQVNYFPAGSLLMQHNASEKEKAQDGHIKPAPANPEPPLIFGYSDQGYLTDVLKEARSLAAMLNGECYLDADATITRLAEKASGSPIIHLATHGHSRMDAPNFSSVRLADGHFNALDAFSLDLKRCELVTLSGCETGLALSGGGDEQLGLARAFMAAGAGSLVTSLWAVEDTATSELMQLFYQHLLRGESKAQALRAAQSSLLCRTGSACAHPYYWAAFRLVGESGPLRYQAVAQQSDAKKNEVSTS
ncbi:MAG TPA: CHAT domain-containing protein [Ktedonobacteraceae bacterium]|nr:CHAT domain-containing protein [Ktedonobacteraceae bacterium]